MTTITIGGNTFRVISSTPARLAANVAKLAKVRRKAHRVIERPLDGDPVSSGTLTLSMAPPSVNSLFHNRKKGRGKTLAYRSWCAAVNAELRAQPSWHVPGRVAIVIRSNSRTDIDNRLKSSLDALVNAGRIEGDSPRHVVDSRSIHDPSVKGTLIEIEASP